MVFWIIVFLFFAQRFGLALVLAVITGQWLAAALSFVFFMVAKFKGIEEK